MDEWKQKSDELWLRNDGASIMLFSGEYFAWDAGLTPCGVYQNLETAKGSVCPF